MMNCAAAAVRTVIGRKYSELLREPLEKLCFNIIEMPDNPLVDSRLSGHIDISMITVGPDKVLIPVNLKDTDIESELLKAGINTVYTHKKQGRDYPADSIINVCVSGNYLFMNPKTADETVKEYFPDKRIIAVKQGYTGCAVCRAGEDSIITSDAGIHRAAEKNGLNSLLIQPGFFDLEGYDYGFIGGSSFLFEGKLYFTGSIENHPSYNEIRSFLSNISVDFEFLTDRIAFDIGGALILQN